MTNTMFVTKRDGTQAPYDIIKIRQVVNWACDGLVSPIPLEGSLSLKVRDGVTTRFIQDSLIRCALELCNPQEPAWRKVAGRLHIWGLWKDVKVNRGYGYGNYVQAVHYQIDAGRYDRKLVEVYTDEQLEIASGWINPDLDQNYDYAGASLLTKRFLVENELPQEAYLTCALLAASVEPESERLYQARQFYRAISQHKLSLATPILANLRRPNASLSSCFIIAMDDDLDSIYSAIHDAARISKSGGGVGCVDGETEFLTPFGWKKFSDYDSSVDELVGQYNASTDTIEFVKPTLFIKEPCSEINYFRTKYGVSQKICDDHRVLYYSEGSRTLQHPITGKTLADKFLTGKGFRGLLKTAFTSVQSEGLAYSDARLRLITAIQADGTFPNGSNRCIIQVKKTRKAARLQEILESLGLEYKLTLTPCGLHHYSFIAPDKIKVFPPEFYQLSTHQLKVISEECLYWDGSKEQNRYFSRVENNADFIQFAFSAHGKRASKATYKRDNGIDYVVTVSENPYVGLRIDQRLDHEIYSRVPTTDGYKYCFSVPSDCLILRHNGQVFSTHNCNVSRIRAAGSWVQNRANSSGGVVPWIKLLNDTAIAVNQGGRRAGAFTVSLDVWHRDIPEFLEMQTENGDQRRKAYDVFPQLVIPDLFMQRVLQNETWTLVDPYEVRQVYGVELAELWGEQFERVYLQLEQDGKLTLTEQVQAKDLFRSIMKTQIETGLPYLAFKDEINRRNPNKHKGYIPGVNLCVAPETRVLTDQGQIPIKDLEGTVVKVWNGFEWSQVEVRKTGENQRLLKVHLSNGEILECTYHHHFWVQVDYKGKLKQVDAKDLKPGDKLIKYDLPLVSSTDDVPFPSVYTSGLDKFTVPLNGYTVKSRLDWLAGLADAEGTIQRNGDNEQLVISSVHPNFLREVRLMLQTLGVDSKVTQMFKPMTRLLPDGKGSKKSYDCKASYRLIITSNGLYSLSQLGFTTNRLKWEVRHPQRDAARFIQVEKVEFTDRFDDTYCFSEPLRHLGMFNGILTGQCVESYSNVKPGEEAHTCNLISLNLANIRGSEELQHCCSLAVRLLDNTIDLTTTPISASKRHNDLYRTIGIGSMGLADWLAFNHLRYSNVEEINDWYEDIAYYCIKASADLAIKRGSFQAYEGSEWSQGKILCRESQWFDVNSKKADRWHKLSHQIQTTGIRNSQILAIAPNTSSALIQGCTASVLPVFSRFFYEKGKVAVPMAPPFIDTHLWFYEENKRLHPSIVVNAIAAIQKWTDTGISMELLFNLNKGVYSDEPVAITAKEIFEVLMQAWKSGCKAIYYIRSIQKDDTDSYKEQASECSVCAN